ncbi:MAG: hypothetical protein JWL84_1987 [Rhodospirillales bacterium]|nr:hypothetical protein [Rhodospirillales bacterium]
MGYIITSTGLGGAISFRRDRAEDALNKAAELRQGTVTSVQITDEQGNVLDEAKLAGKLGG